MYNIILSTGILYLSVTVDGKVSSKPGASSTLDRDCSCGFYDGSTGNLFTDSLIVYFNETGSVPSNDFIIQEYTHQYEKGWNSKYREGATLDNVLVGNNNTGPGSNSLMQSLELYVDKSMDNHLIKGSVIESVRQDMHYGSFSALVRGPQPWRGGSALSMMFRHNDTQEFAINLQNTNSPELAWMSTLMAGEFPDRNLGVNYSTLSNVSLSNYTSSPWGYVELKVDWSKNSMNFSYNDIVSRTVTRKEESTLPSVPGPLLFKHWSVGNHYSMDGPPTSRSLANVAWTRSFFNSSTMSEEVRKDFDARCDITRACSMADTSLRGSTGYSASATKPWKQKNYNFSLKIFAIVLVVFGAIIGTVVITNAIARQIVAKRNLPPPKEEIAPPSPFSETESSAAKQKVTFESTLVTDMSSAASSVTAFSPVYRHFATSGTSTVIGTPAPSYRSPAPSIHPPLPNYSLPLERVDHANVGFTPVEVSVPKTDLGETDKQDSKDKKGIETTTELRLLATTPMQSLNQRVDYMAGTVAVGSLLVTLIHFALTFVPALTSGYNEHYKSELGARNTIVPYFMNQIWLGLFFTTTSRFLTQRYLKFGDLRNIAQRTVTRTPRLMIPIIGIVLLQYFLIDCGALHWLEYLPSVTWSAWPYAVAYDNFGHFINEVLELIYLIPNAFPQITFNYCTGVLWTIPVTLQGSWTSLLGVVVVREIKKPVKRFSFYTFCIIMNWYAMSWGSYFWVGLMISDMDTVWKKYLFARPWLRHFATVVSITIALAMLTFDLILIQTGIDILGLERGIHPDYPTGRPISQTPIAGYPNYFEPRLNGLIFAGVLGLGVEITPLAQKALSNRVLMWVFPHIFTIYLLHGFVFWSLGAFVCIQLSAHGMPYWANMLITALVSWGTLFAVLPLVTPAVEMLGIHCTAMVWKFAYEAPAKKFDTLWPFGKDMLLKRDGKPGVKSDEETGKGKSLQVGVEEGEVDGK